MDIDATVHVTPEALPKRRGVMFDPTINLGHVLTAVAFITSGVVAYNNLDKRLAIQEQLSAQLVAQRAEKDAVFKETLRDVQGDVKEMNRSVMELSKSINQRPQK